MKRFSTLVLVILVSLIGLLPPAQAGPRSAAIRQVAESAVGKFGQEGSKEGVETLARRLETLVAHHGEAALTAVSKAGPQVVPLVEQAGAHGNVAVRLLARYGEEAV